MVRRGGIFFFSLVSYDKVCFPKYMGGLGIRIISLLNRALMVKIAWKLAQNNADWCRIMCAKYLNQEKFCKTLSI